MERKPTRPDQLPRHNFSVPCSGGGSAVSENPTHTSHLSCLISTQTRCTGAAGCNADLPFLIPRQLRRLVLYECMPRTVHDQNHLAPKPSACLPAHLSGYSTVLPSIYLFVLSHLQVISSPDSRRCGWGSTPTFPPGVGKLCPSRGGPPRGISVFPSSAYLGL